MEVANPVEALDAGEIVAKTLFALVLILGLARLVGSLFAKLGQPRVVGEIVAGVLLGPTVVPGVLASGGLPDEGVPERGGSGLLNDLFPLEVFAFLDLLGLVAIVLFMLLLGLEVEHKLLRGREQQIVVVSLALVAVPVIAGFGLGAVLDSPTWKAQTTLAGDPVSATTHALFIGAALTVSASAALARILQEKRMMRTDLGAIGMGATTLVTILMFIVLASAVASSEGSGLGGAVGAKLGLTMLMVAVLVGVVRPLLRVLLNRRYDPDRPLDETLLSVLLLGTLVSALAADQIGINALTGGFMFGAVVPQLEGLSAAITQRLQTLLVVFFIPVFLAVSGLQTDLGVIKPELLGGIALFLVLAVLTKWWAAVPVGMMTGLSWRESNVLGLLLNCRGLEILIVALVGTQLGVVTDEMQAAFVVAAIVTTLMTGPGVDLFIPDAAVEEERQKTIHESMMAIPRMTGGPRVLVAPGSPADAAAVLVAAEEFLEEDPPSQFLVVNLPGLPGGGEVIGHGAWEEGRVVARTLGWLGPIAERLSAGDNDAEATSFQSPSPAADLGRLAQDWAATIAIVSDAAVEPRLEEIGLDVRVV